MWYGETKGSEMYRVELLAKVLMLVGIGVGGGSSAAAEGVLSPSTGISIGIGITVASSALFFGVRAGRLMERLVHLEISLDTMRETAKEHEAALAVCKSSHRQMVEAIDKRVIRLEAHTDA